jgi:hypothetical protein
MGLGEVPACFAPSPHSSRPSAVLGQSCNPGSHGVDGVALRCGGADASTTDYPPDLICT